LLQQIDGKRTDQAQGILPPPTSAPPVDWSTALSLYQFNLGHPEKGSMYNQSQKFISATLTEERVDFFNVVNFPDVSVLSSFGTTFGTIVSPACQTKDVDLTTLIYNKTRWKTIQNHTGCLVEGDSPYVVAAFESKINAKRLVVVGAHYALFKTGASEKALKDVLKSNNLDSYDIVLLADTNILNRPWTYTNAWLFQDLGLKEGAKTPTNSMTCCYHSPAMALVPYADRIITSLPGATAAVTVHDYVTPSVSSMHKPISVILRNAWGS